MTRTTAFSLEAGPLVDLGVGYPPVSTKIAAAWRVVEALHERGDCLTLVYLQTFRDHEKTLALEYKARFRIADACGYGPTAPEAICRAALKAMERNDDL
jgi:hypothetical protein